MATKSYLHLHMPRRRRFSFTVRLLLASILSVMLYFLGFAIFIASLPSPFTTLPEGLQALAVFTGGSGRVDAALTSLTQGFNGPILISGSHPQTKLPDILTSAGTALHLTEAQQKQITLDTAATTQENILSLKSWATQNKLTRIGIITSTYHAPRVQVLAWWKMPEVEITLLPVQSPSSGLKLMLQEYNKLLSAPFLR